MVSRSPIKVFIEHFLTNVAPLNSSYVAVTGLPDPQKKHALLMARFAQECMEKMAELVKRLETSLGPDTGDLSMRFGINSGPVTAGVLRGERARFQLFGDTVNTASRMESTGMRSRIHASQSTVDLLIASGKQHWVQKREEAIEAKGKGTMQTYWLNPRSRNTTASIVSSGSGGDSSGRPGLHRAFSSLSAHEILARRSEKQERLIEWNVQLLVSHLKDIVAHRQNVVSECQSPEKLIYRAPPGQMVLDEVKEVIELPKFDPQTMSSIASFDSKKVEISKEAISQLTNYVSIIASMYHDNAFHNFEVSETSTCSENETNAMFSTVIVAFHSTLRMYQ